MPYIPPLDSSGTDSSAGGLVVEVEREVFLGLLEQGSDKALVFEHHGGFPKSYRYYVRLGAYYFLFRSRQKQDLASVAHLLPVVGFHTSPGSVV